VAAATSGNKITLTGVAWNDGLKTAVETALSGSGGIDLDLSGVSGLTEWSKDTLGSNKDKINRLVLPDTVTTLKDGIEEDYAFYGYTSLASVSGAGVTDIGALAFVECPDLTTVSLPAAVNIGWYAFSYCPALTTVNLPAATDISGRAFNMCTALTTVDLPAAENIGEYAFGECTALTTVNLPAAVNIGPAAFHDCTALTSLTLPAVPPTLESAVFKDTGNSGTLEIYVGSGNVEAYTTAWGVSAETAFGVNSTAYGSNHKTIHIVE
jgi:hypothetical protein